MVRRLQAGVWHTTVGGGREEAKSSPEQRELVTQCWVSNVSLYFRDRVVLLKLQEWGDSLGATLQRVDSGSLSLGQAGGRNSCSQEPSSLMVTRAYPRGAGGSLGRRKESEE